MGWSCGLWVQLWVVGWLWVVRRLVSMGLMGWLMGWSLGSVGWSCQQRLVVGCADTDLDSSCLGCLWVVKTHLFVKQWVSFVGCQKLCSMWVVGCLDGSSAWSLFVGCGLFRGSLPKCLWVVGLSCGVVPLFVGSEHLGLHMWVVGCFDWVVNLFVSRHAQELVCMGCQRLFVGQWVVCGLWVPFVELVGQFAGLWVVCGLCPQTPGSDWVSLWRPVGAVQWQSGSKLYPHPWVQFVGCEPPARL